ncbi:hypothetical protein QMK17_22670 [Rhodococcus sp. G-MC3]|uniref:hypothetical protein n=1 Tax=Rhodococcus sp. G-MC3 TaxID=3046209 RepID=UPI0024BBAA29|nr:hypothetical protein [Rhodococcus sp. G-MC3]MDJ0396129.1 hypothetical protein [Rhodococcus sp. G-MC3]
MVDSRGLDRIRTASVVVTIISVGVVAASFISTPNNVVADGGTAATTSEVVTEPVEYPVDIPGCDDVQEPPTESESMLFSSSIGGGESTYDNPAFPWMTSGRAAVMSEAVRAALPSDVDIVLAAPSQSLSFGPVEDIDVPGFDPVSNATAELMRDGSAAFVSLGVGPSDKGAPPCVAGSLDSRDTDSDGTVVDINDTWYEIAGTRTYSRSATAYRQDGTRVSVHLSAPSSPTLPLEQDEIAAIAALPELGVSTPLPSEPPVLRRDCSVYSSDEGTVRDINPEALDAANAAFTASWASLRGAPALDRPVGSLIPAGFGSGICTDVAVLGSSIRLAVSVVGNQPLPTAPDPYDPSFYGQLPETRTLPDGSVIQYFDADVTNMLTSEDGTGLLSRSVTVTRPSGVQVSARSSVEVGANGKAPLTLPEPLPVGILDVVAATPIGQWP